MSAEAFETVLSCDVRTAPDGRGVERAPAGSGQPRLSDVFHDPSQPRSRAWATCFVYAEGAVKAASDAVRDQEMAGLTGDQPAMREQAAAVLDAAADLVRSLALDHAYDGPVTAQRFAERLQAVADAAAPPAAGQERA